MKWLATYEEQLVTFLKRELAPSTERWHATIRVLTATVILMLITQVFHLEQGYWALVTITTICAPNVDSSLRKMLQRLLGTIAGIAVAYIITAVFYQQFWFYLAALFLAILLSGLIIARSEEPYVGWVFALSILVVALESQTPFSQIASVSFTRFWIVALGVLSSWIALALIYPVRPIRDFRRIYLIVVDHEIERAQWVMAHLRELDSATETLLPKRVDPMDSKQMFVLLESAAYTDRVIRDNLGALTDRINLLGAISTISNNAIVLIKNFDPLQSNPALTKATLGLIEALTSILRQKQAWARSDHDLIESIDLHPIDFQPLADAIRAFDRTHEAQIVQQGIREGSGRSTPGNQALMATIAMCRAFDTTYSGHTVRGSTNRSYVNVLRAFTTPLLSPGLSDDASRSFLFAVKLASACVIGLLFIKATKFDGMSTMILTPLMIVGATGGSSDATWTRAKLRFIGTIIGAIVSLFAILVLIPTVDSIAGLLLLWIGCSAPLLWLMNGGPNISFLGVQAVFSLSIALGSTFQPSIDLGIPSARICGIFLGTLVTLAIFNYFAPDNPRNELRRIFALTMDRMGALATMGFPSNPGTLADITALRYKLISLILRSRTLGQSVQRESHAIEPAITADQIEDIAEHLTLILYINNALAMNRVAARLLPQTMVGELAEFYECAQSIRRTCEIGCSAMNTEQYAEFSTATKLLAIQAKELEELIPTIRQRPSIQTMTAEPVEFILGQIGMYRIAAMHLCDLADALVRTSADRSTTSPPQGSPVRFALSSTA